MFEWYRKAKTILDTRTLRTGSCERKKIKSEGKESAGLPRIV